MELSEIYGYPRDDFGGKANKKISGAVCQRENLKFVPASFEIPTPPKIFNFLMSQLQGLLGTQVRPSGHLWELHQPDAAKEKRYKQYFLTTTLY